MAAEPLIHWPDPVVELVEFVGVFLAGGAVGFRYAVLRGRLTPGLAGRTEAAVDIPGVAARRAAGIGLVGTVLVAIRLALSLPDVAARSHTTSIGALTHVPVVALWAVLTAVALIGFLLARRASPAAWRVGWPLAAIGIIAGVLRNGLVGQWARLVNPAHLLAGALWIGTLFALVAAGLPAIRRNGRGERAGALVAQMINAFSPFALVCGGVLVVFGVITAWQHLKTLSALWTTPYGYTLIAKLCVVALVFSLGTWNWRRQRPLLGSEAAAHSIRRSATAELAVATIVLLITSILVSLPAPKPPV